MTAPYTDPTNVGNKPGDGPLRADGVSVSALTSHEQDLPSTPNAAAARQLPALILVRDLAAGPEKIRGRSTQYLPQAPGENPKNYNSRLLRSVFFNYFGKTIEGLTGFVFAKDPKLGDDVPAPIVQAAENITLDGTHLDVFARELFQDAITAGHAGIFVEFPATNGAQDHAAEARQVIRPYWIAIKKDAIVSWRTTIEDGHLVVTQLVLKECQMVAKGAFGEEEQTRYRVLWNQNGVVGFQLLEVMKDKSVVEVGNGLYPTQSEIPFAEIVTSGRQSIFESKPPLLDLAYLNIAHYQQWSDYANGIHKTNVPLLKIVGANLGDEGAATEVTVGPDTVLNLPIGGDAAYVSHDGAALGATKAALDDLASAMSVMGLSMLAPSKRAAETAEAKRIDKAGSDSSLGVAARGLQDGIERALQFHAKYLLLPDGGSITINRDFESMVMDAATMSAYADLADKLGLPLRVVLDALQAGGRISEDTNLDDLEAEMAANKAATDAARLQEAQDRLTMAVDGAVPKAKAPGAMDIQYNDQGRPSRLSPAA